MGDTATRDPDDERDDLAALDFGGADEPGDAVGHSDLDVLDIYPATDEQPPGAVFTVTNPPGTVTVSAFADGRIQQIALSPAVTEMTEADLADEIVVIAGLAAQDAKSAQFAAMLDGMRAQGHADAATRDFLSRDLGLPTPQQARAERARVFATRYCGDHD